jgi:D-serine deaminase-like pyridoxal phosphate-dependent protein
VSPHLIAGESLAKAWEHARMRETPFVQIDPGILRSNIEAMQRFCDSRGLALRPHAKTHKCLQVADWQLSAGAVGLSVATVGEAEVFADLVAARSGDLLIAYPVGVSPDRLRKLAAQVPTIVGVDSAAGVRRTVGVGVSVSIEIDSGLGRTGVAPAEAGTLAAYARSLGVHVTGVFTFPGHGYALGVARAEAAADEARALRVASAALRAAGLEEVVASGGCTPTASLVHAETVTELRPGVYVFMDAGQLALGAAHHKQIALTVRTTVVSDAVPNQVVLDCGAKVLGMDRPAFVDGHGLLPAYPGTRLSRLWEHHAIVEIPAGIAGPTLGEQLDVIPNHVCATVNLVDELVVGDEVWAVSARGRNS